MRSSRTSSTGRTGKAAGPARADVPVRVLEVTPGQRIEATVARVDGDGTVWIGWRGGLMPARSSVPLTPGASYSFTVAEADEDRIRLRAAERRGGLPALADALAAGLLGTPGTDGLGEREPGATPESHPWWCFLPEDQADGSPTNGAEIPPGGWVAVSTRWGGVRIDAAPDRIRAQVSDPNSLPAARAALAASWPNHDLHVRTAPGNKVPFGDLLGLRAAPNSSSTSGQSLLDIKV